MHWSYPLPWFGSSKTFQNLVLSSNLSEFHSGYRVYKVNSLKKIPFELNANDYSFDTEIIIQLIISKLLSIHYILKRLQIVRQKKFL